MDHPTTSCRGCKAWEVDGPSGELGYCHVRDDRTHAAGVCPMFERRTDS